MSFEFPLRQKLTPFGLVSDPKIPVTIPTPDTSRSYYFLLDTGADFSVAPKRLAEQLGLDWNGLTEVRMVGVEQRGVQARAGQLPVDIEHLSLTVRCFFAAAPRTPFILGRADFLDRLVLHIDPFLRRIILTERD